MSVIGLISAESQIRYLKLKAISDRYGEVIETINTSVNNATDINSWEVKIPVPVENDLFKYLEHKGYSVQIFQDFAKVRFSGSAILNA